MAAGAVSSDNRVETMAMTPTDLAGLERTDLESTLAASGEARFRGRQIFQWIHQHGATGFEAMTSLDRGLRARLSGAFRIMTPAVSGSQTSVDGTTKFLLAFDDGRQVEAVYIPDTPNQTFCISTQVGCAMACGFCLTGKMGLVRHLTAGEIAGQVRVLARETGLAGGIFNIVLMGMGEPLHNYDETMRAVRILADEDGLAVHPRRVTLSTVGILPALARLADEPVMPNLAISLHGTTDEQRDRLVPINRRYPIADLLDACRRFPLRRRGRITFEYVLLAGVNDSAEDARRLARLLGDLRAKVNLLPLNEAPGIPFSRPSDAAVDAFARRVAEHGLPVSVRRSRGRDIRAACGQLLVEGQRRSTGQVAAARLASGGAPRHG
jgi:23S rRNA (adenine2503-C2)-methyltransferase